jgi:hypothetical protein
MTMRNILIAMLLLGAPRAAFACPVCFGQSDSPMAAATNMGIIAMLGVVAGVLACFATFFIHLMRRERLAADRTGASYTAAGSNAQEGTAQC